MCRVLLLALCAGSVFAQSAPGPEERLKSAIAAQQSGRVDEAIREYQSLLAQYPDVPLLRSNLGAAFAAEGRYSEAIDEYNRSLKLQPNPQVRLNLALAYYKRQDLDNCIQTLQQVRAADPGNLQAITLLADSYLQIGENKKVIQMLTPIQQAHPEERSFEYLLGTALVRDGRADRGQIIIDKILRDGDSAEARLLMGTTKYMVADFSGARDDFQKAIALNPSLPDAHAYYGLALLATGDQAAARDAFVYELRQNPNNFESNLHLGVLYRNDQDYGSALKYLAHALVIRPADPGVRYQIAAIELSNGELSDAQRHLESLVKDSPDFIEAHLTLATVYSREKRSEDADRERAIFSRLNAERQAKAEIAAKSAQ